MAVNVYKKQIEAVLAGLKPEVAEKLNDIGRQVLSFALVLAAQYGAGDAMAGKILEDWGLASIGKVSSVAEQLGIKLSSTVTSPRAWWVSNLDTLADGLLTEELADRIKTGAKSGRGI
jgi:NTP pyrophosphatase (non-canonical NTP hydrolase)